MLREREIMDTFPVTVASKKIKYLEMNPTKEVKDVHNDSFKSLKTWIEEGTNMKECTMLMD